MWRRLVQVAVGLVLYGFASAVMIRAAIGLDPWGSFTKGFL